MASEATDLGLPCVHCGLCLHTCPTYRVLGTEADSPRGRIYIMESVARGELELDADAAGHLDGCLGCLACETACPSGVSFGTRIEAFRPRLRASGPAAWWRSLAGTVLGNGALVRAGMEAAGALDRLGLIRMRSRIPGLGVYPRAGNPRRLHGSGPLARSRIAPPAQPRIRVALLTGCVGDTLLPSINSAAVEALHRNRVAVIDVQGQGCCGALARHQGELEQSLHLVRANVRAFAAAPVDRIVTTAAGCCAMMRDYGELLADDRELADAARRVAAATRDVHELLVEIGFDAPSEPAPVRLPVRYHDACHLLNACGVAAAPRAVLEAATGQPPTDLGDNEICCGSAGRYNVDHPRMAAALGRRKADLAAKARAGTVAVANVGCLLQIGQALARDGIDADVRHPIELLAEAYMRESR